MIKRRRLCLASLILPCFLWKRSLSCLVCTTNVIQATSPAAARLLCLGQSQQQQQQKAAAFLTPYKTEMTTNSKTLLPALLPRHLQPLTVTAAAICSPQTKVYGANVALMRNTGLMIQMNYAMMPRNRNGNQLAAASDDSSMHSGDESNSVKNVDDDPLKEEGGDRLADEEDVVEKYSPSSSSDVASATMLASLQFYKQVISPLLPPACRFVPTCSMYSVQAIRELGPVKGAILIAWRLLRCSPIGGKGYDPPRYVCTPLVTTTILFSRVAWFGKMLFVAHHSFGGQVATSLLHLQQLLTLFVLVLCATDECQQQHHLKTMNGLLGLP
jgi:uncharacterized protein